jgi:hypothetical protein
VGGPQDGQFALGPALPGPHAPHEFPELSQICSGIKANIDFNSRVIVQVVFGQISHFRLALIGTWRESMPIRDLV